MQPSLLKFMAVATTMTAVPFALVAQDEGDSGWNHFGMDARLGFNIKAKFMNEGGFTASAPTAPAGPPAPAPRVTDIIARDDLRTDGLVGSPPDHPPRTLV